jgi:hypothetical protein
VVTIRLKNLREGLEDYEYLALLAARAGREAADAAAAAVAPSWFDWERDPAKLLAAREAIAERILAAGEAKAGKKGRRRSSISCPADSPGCPAPARRPPS